MNVRMFCKGLVLLLVFQGMVILTSCSSTNIAQDVVPIRQVLFSQGEAGYSNYRIPALMVSERGTILAFCEARKAVSDHGDIDIVLKRSLDGGKTWLPMQTVIAENEVVLSNPCPVQDPVTGKIWLHVRRADERIKPTPVNVFVLYSEDDGETWSTPIDIASSLNPAWTHCFPGPGHGIVLERGEKKGRITIPGWHNASGVSSHVVFSDDHGATWSFGGKTSLVDESTVVELADGRLMMNMRPWYRDPDLQTYRKVSYSSDYGLTWSEGLYDTNLPCSSCQASILRYSWPDEEEGKILFMNPNSSKLWDRRDLTVRVSDDEGQSWSRSKLLHEGPAGYSDMALLPDGRVACVYEGGETAYYENIFFQTFKVHHLK